MPDQAPTPRHLPIFVYGTLKRGEERERCWPRKPGLVEWGTVRGRLYDLGPYPALTEGDDWVLGELWHVPPSDLETTLATLDAVECYGQDDVDLYVRRIVTCRLLSGEERAAFTYFYANPDELTHTPIVVPDRDGFCQWTARRR